MGSFGESSKPIDGPILKGPGMESGTVSRGGGCSRRWFNSIGLSTSYDGIGLVTF